MCAMLERLGLRRPAGSISSRVAGTVSTQRFSELWVNLEKLLSNVTTSSVRSVEGTEIPTCLCEMARMLLEEEAQLGPSVPGGCFVFFQRHGLAAVLAESFKAEVYVGLRVQVLVFFKTILERVDSRFIEAVYVPTLHILDSACSDPTFAGRHMWLIVDLYYVVCRKFKDNSVLLALIYRDNLANAYQGHGAVRTDKGGDFPFFRNLLAFIHCDGKVGDYARSSVLFCLEAADGILDAFLQQSDFTDIVAAALGGLYSQLPRTSGLSPVKPRARDGSADPFDVLIAFLDFCQNIVHKSRGTSRGSSDTLSNALLLSIRRFFLESIVYPDIEAAATDEFQSVVVCVNRMLLSLEADRDGLAGLFVDFLLRPSHDQVVEDGCASPRKPRQSLLPLLMSKVAFESEPVALVVLRLFTTLLLLHSQQSLPYMFADVSKEPSCHPVSQHESRCVASWIALVPTRHTNASQEVSGLDAYLNDAEDAIESQLTLLSERPEFLEPSFAERSTCINESVFLQTLLGRLARFIDQSFELNLVLTETISTLAASPCKTVYEHLFEVPDSAENAAAPRALYSVLQALSVRRSRSDSQSRVTDETKRLEGEPAGAGHHDHFVRNSALFYGFLKELVSLFISQLLRGDDGPKGGPTLMPV